MDKGPGLSVRLKLTLSYAGFLMLAGALLLAAVWVFLLRYVPRGGTVIVHNTHVFVSPSRGALLRDFAPAVAFSGYPSCCSVSWEGGFSPAGCSPP
jgi:two-component system, OmpR family, sensor histidine kinase VanS